MNIGGYAGSTEQFKRSTDDIGGRKLYQNLLEADILAHAKKLAVAGPN
jgi:hypothetical protein